ncbi:MAG: hypothetical protein K6G10_03610 [Butyrivibrio sp.]|nr:hypothetical protein [Butyrivibrio sp.]
MKKFLFCLIFAVSLLANLYFATEKSGYHEDEYYTYYSSNRSLGLYQPDREWQDRQTILDEFSVKKGEGFNYMMVSLVQSWDVHPPVYYFIFHTLCSFVPGVFTKWTGLITNLIAFTLSFGLLILILKKLKAPDYITFTILAFYGLNPQTISCTLLFRMYGWLTVAVLACAYLHLRIIEDYKQAGSDLKKLVIKYFLPVMAISYLGFLTQYFYIFFFVSIGFALTVWLVFFRKDIKNGAVYVLCCAVSLGLAVISYPASLHHMFGGYRGSDAAGGLFDMSTTGMRLSFFVGLLNDFVFAGGLIVIVIMIMLGIMYNRLFLGKKAAKTVPDPKIVILSFAALGYFLLTAKSALLVGSASNRYEMPIYPLMILLVFLDAHYVLGKIGNRTLMYVLCAVSAAFLLKGLAFDHNVLFLYKEDREKMAYAQENNGSVAVVMFNPATPQNVWRLTDELLMYQKVFYMDEENLEALTDPEVTGAEKIILYAADDDLQTKAFENLTTSCTKVSQMTKVSVEDMWTTYEVN